MSTIFEISIFRFLVPKLNRKIQPCMDLVGRGQVTPVTKGKCSELPGAPGPPGNKISGPGAPGEKKLGPARPPVPNFFSPGAPGPQILFPGDPGAPK